jgi:folate-binding protein YgfZ
VSEELAWSTLRVSGPDATSFLDGQLSQDLARAHDGAWTLLLQPDGSVVSAGWLRRADDGWDLLVPAARGEATLARLRRFLVRVACQIDLTPGASAPPLSSLDELLDRRWPWANEFALELVPHAYGRAFVAATVSFTKGCFTGQEMVGRMDARGANMPWRLVYATGPSPEAIDRALREVGPDGPQGLTTTVAAGDGWRALGVAHRTRLTSVSDVDGVRLEEIGD